MRRSRGLVALTLLMTSAVVAMCVYPTEHDAAVHVSLTPVHILFSGHDTVAAARAWQVRCPGDSVVIPNVAFTWSTSDAAVATVSSDGRIVGIKSGSAIITAAATNFDAGQRAAADTVRVSAPIEVDSIRPKTVRYGEFLTVYGIGVDSIFVASLDSASLIPNPVERSEEHTSELQSKSNLVCRLLLEKKKKLYRYLTCTSSSRRRVSSRPS